MELEMHSYRGNMELVRGGWCGSQEGMKAGMHEYGRGMKRKSKDEGMTRSLESYSDIWLD